MPGALLPRAPSATSGFASLRPVKRQLTAALVVAFVCAAAFAVPALGGPSVTALAKKVALALKIARTADKRSKDALALAKRGSGTNRAGTNGAPGSSGGSGSTGPAGPPGPSGATKIDFRAPAPTGATKIFDFGGLVLTASCDPGPNLNVKASSTVADSEFHLSGDTHTVNPGPPPTVTVVPVYSESDHLGPTSPGVALPGSNFQGTFTFSTPAGAVVTGTVAAEQTAFNGKTGCWFGGWALRDPA
jgi:hypothetical protein